MKFAERLAITNSAFFGCPKILANQARKVFLPDKLVDALNGIWEGFVLFLCLLLYILLIPYRIVKFFPYIYVYTLFFRDDGYLESLKMRVKELNEAKIYHKPK